MWIASTLGWFSVVIDNERPGRMLVRARCRQDALNLYEANKDLASIEKPTSDPTRDYRYRLSIDKLDWVVLASRLAQAVDYSNFKSEVAKQPSQRNKHDAYHEVWATLYRVQLDERLTDETTTPKPAKRKKARSVPATD